MKWLEVKNVTNTTAEIYIFGDIVDDRYNFKEDWDTNIYPLDIKEKLEEVKDKDLFVHINSCGGDIFAGVAICNMLKNHKKATTAIIDGLAGSIASVIAFGCDKIEMAENSFLMLHKPLVSTMGNADDLTKVIETLNNIENSIVMTYMSKALGHVTEDKIKELLKSETWLNGQQAKEYFKIEVKEALKMVAFCSENYFNNLKNCPESIKNTNEYKNSNFDNKNSQNTTENVKNNDMLKKEIDIALSL